MMWLFDFASLRQASAACVYIYIVIAEGVDALHHLVREGHSWPAAKVHCQGVLQICDVDYQMKRQGTH